MINKGQLVVLPYLAVKDLPGLQISPPGVIPQCDCRPCWIVDHSWWDINADTLPLAAMDAMQFGHAHNQILCKILLSNPLLGPVYLIKLDILVMAFIGLPSTLMTYQNWGSPSPWPPMKTR